jgi:hypothetical protein
MACDNPPCKDTEQIESSDLPVYDKATLPTDAKLILLVDQPDYDNGGQVNVAYRLPLSRVMPGSAPQHVAYSLSDVDAGITIPDEEIVPAYVESFGNFDLKRAQANSSTTKAKFLIVGLDPNVDGSYIIQGSGFFSFPTVHGYNVGQTYYLSDSTPGGVTTTPPSGIAQPLFTAVDQKTILIQIGD